MKSRSLLFATFISLSSSASATVLTFDATPTFGAGTNMPQNYGDRVVAASMPDLLSPPRTFQYGLAGGITPNVLVGYVGGVSNPLNAWTTGYSDLTNVVEYEVDGDSPLRLTFTADTGFNVRLDSFDIGNFGGAITIPSIKVLNESSAELFSTLNYSLAANSQPHQTLTFAGGLSGQSLSLVIDLTGLGGNSDNVGLDNIQFAQATAAIPEPSTYALMLAGLGVVGFVARRRRASAAKAA